MSLFLVAEIRIKPEFFNDARQALLGIVDQTLAEPGCQLFDVLETEDRTALWLYERWDNDQALALHYEKVYTKQVFSSYQEWLTEPARAVHLRRLAPSL